MSKETSLKVTDAGIASKESKGDREKRWEAYVANYAQKNPVKYAAKRATTFIEVVNGKEVERQKADEFATIPVSFK